MPHFAALQTVQEVPVSVYFILFMFLSSDRSVVTPYYGIPQQCYLAFFLASSPFFACLFSLFLARGLAVLALLELGMFPHQPPK